MDRKRFSLKNMLHFAILLCLEGCKSDTILNIAEFFLEPVVIYINLRKDEEILLA